MKFPFGLNREAPNEAHLDPPAVSWRKRAGGPHRRGTGGKRIKTPPMAKTKRVRPFMGRRI